MDIPQRQREGIRQLDLANQLTIIRALREEQELKNSNYGTQYARNDKRSMMDGNNTSYSKSDYIKLNNDFYELLAQKESSNDYTKTLDDNQGIGAIGKYQFRKPAFQETGYMDEKGKFTGKNNIYSVEDFINNTHVQELAVSELVNKNYLYMKHYRVLNYLGKKLSGKVSDFPITLSGMLAAAHKEGGPMIAKYLKSLEKNEEGMYYLPYHKYRGNTLRSFLAIETRLREFSNLKTDN